jgi:hypothetical protein
VNYLTTWKIHYKAMGEPPPPGAKDTINVDSVFKEWYRDFSIRDKLEASRLLGLPLWADELAAARLSPPSRPPPPSPLPPQQQHVAAAKPPPSGRMVVQVPGGVLGVWRRR